MKTAVEWFIINLIQVCGAPPEGTWKEVENLLHQAKEMEKEQMESAYLAGESKDKQYYNETFKSDEQE